VLLLLVVVEVLPVDVVAVGSLDSLACQVVVVVQNPVRLELEGVEEPSWV
jgi:hypothetical protein